MGWWTPEFGSRQARAKKADSMAVQQAGRLEVQEALAEELRWQHLRGGVWAAVRRLPVLPMTVLVIFVGVALLGPRLAPHDPDRTDLVARLTPPVWAGGTSQHFLGTDRLGRDVWSRIIVGARPSFGVALVTIG